MLALINALVDYFVVMYVALVVVVFAVYFSSKRRTSELKIPPLPSASSGSSSSGGSGSEGGCPFNGVWTLCGQGNMEAMLEFQGVNYFKRLVMMKVLLFFPFFQHRFIC